MLSPRGCIYCSGALLTDEHYLPIGLGKFRGCELLKDRVCKACQAKCARLEEQFLRSGPEAFFRKLVGKVGRKHHKKVEIFLRRHEGTDPIRVTGTYPGEPYDILWEPDEGTRKACAMRQIIVRDEEGKYHPIPISESMEPEHVKDFLSERFKGKSFKLVAVFAEPADYEKMQAITAAIDPKGKLEWREGVDERRRTTVTGVAAVTDKYFRAIAKIGFHYFLKMSDRYSGHEEVFDGIKHFVMHGGDWRPHVRWSRGSLAANVDAYAPPNAYLHILIAEKQYMVIRARLQFFIGPDVQPLIYEVHLGMNPERIVADEQWAHSYVYFDKKDAEGYDGRMEPMDSVSASLIPGRARTRASGRFVRRPGRLPGRRTSA